MLNFLVQLAVIEWFARHAQPVRKGNERVKLVVSVPLSHLGAVLEAMMRARSGATERYRDGPFAVRGESRSSTERDDEARVEVLCSAGDVGALVEAMRVVHPHKEPRWEMHKVWEPLSSNGEQAKARL
jgi:hypothetical protein